jgi:hypothetical protein
VNVKIFNRGYRDIPALTHVKADSSPAVILPQTTSASEDGTMARLMRRILAAVVIVLVAAGVALAWLNWRVHQETVTPVETLNSGGTAGRVLAVLSPGMSSFPADVMTAFDKGLAEKGWRVDHTTASSEATTDIGAYDLIVLAAPVYFSRAAPPLQDYVGRVGDFGGKQIAVLVTAAGNPAEAVAATKTLIAAHNGTLAGIYGYAVYEPNDPDGKYEGSNTERAVRMAHDAALALADTLP